jgi:hypothetical protein
MIKRLVNHEAFDVVTDDAAYWIGFLFSDGSVFHKKNGGRTIQLRLSEIDRATLRTSVNSSALRMPLLLARLVTSVDTGRGPRFVLQ